MIYDSGPPVYPESLYEIYDEDVYNQYRAENNEWWNKYYLSASKTYLNAYINGVNVEDSEFDYDTNSIKIKTEKGEVFVNVSSSAIKWTDTIAGDNCYGLCYCVDYEPKDDVNLNISFTNDGTPKYCSRYPYSHKFLFNEGNKNSNWWSCCKIYLDKLPASIKSELIDWDSFYATSVDDCGNH